MSIIKKIATAGAVAVMGLGLGAASASAYDLTGGDYTASDSLATTGKQHTFTVGGAYTVACDSTFTGNTDNVAGDAASTDFRPVFTNCDFFGFPADVDIHQDWRLTVTGNTGSTYNGRITLPSGPVATIAVPLIGCEVTVAGTQTFNHGGANLLQGVKNTSPVSFDLNADVSGIVYTDNGLCPFSGSNDGNYTTNGAMNIAGVSVTP